MMEVVFNRVNSFRSKTSFFFKFYSLYLFAVAARTSMNTIKCRRRKRFKIRQSPLENNWIVKNEMCEQKKRKKKRKRKQISNRFFIFDDFSMSKQHQSGQKITSCSMLSISMFGTPNNCFFLRCLLFLFFLFFVSDSKVSAADQISRN